MNTAILICALSLLCMGLILAWLLTCRLYLNVKFVNNLFQDEKQLLRAHIDFLMMSMLLFIIWLVLNFLQTSLHPAIVICLISGTWLNATGFLVLSIYPNINRSPISLPGILFTLVFICTTTGFAGFIYTIYKVTLNG